MSFSLAHGSKGPGAAPNMTYNILSIELDLGGFLLSGMTENEEEEY